MKIKKFVSLATLLILFFINLQAKNVLAINIPKKEKEEVITNNFSGNWIMQTIVTDSNTPFIIIGSTTKSNLEIKPYLNNSLKNLLYKAYWKGGSWKKSTGIIKTLNSKEAITERITQLNTKDKNNWKAILIDRLYLDEENKNIMHSESIVTQFKNGVKVGEYKTYSILTKTK